MKKTTIIICMLFAAVLLFMTGCTAQTEDKITSYSDLDGKIVATVAAPVPMELAKIGIEMQNDITLAEMLYFDSTNAAVAALQSNKADAVFTSAYTANYYMQRNEDLAVIPALGEHLYNLHMALRNDDTELLDLLNETIVSMKEDGTFTEFEKTYITELTIEDTLTGRDIPKIDGARTVYVGISGDIPPLDYIAADGRPAGYSLAVLTEISERAGINFEVVSIANQAKFTALLAERIDVFFFHVLSGEVPAMMETAAANPGIAFTESYYSYRGGTFLVRK